MDQQRILLFQRFLKTLVFYTLLVILWGAWVRISHSGDGCGDTWPLCRGQMIPEAQQNKTWIEYAHRLMSGLYGLFVFGLFIWNRRLFPQIHPARKAGFYTLIFMITEALLGAKLVLFKLVGNDDSFFRLFAMSLHQTNSLLLTGATVIWLYWSQAKTAAPGFRLPKIYFALLLVVAITGAWAALASTLFPSLQLAQGLDQDFASDSHYLLRIRIIHPLIAFLTASFFALFFWKKSQQMGEPVHLQKMALRNSLLFCLGALFGILTLLFLAPVWMKITHLAIAQILWMSLISYAVAGELEITATP